MNVISTKVSLPTWYINQFVMLTSILWKLYSDSIKSENCIDQTCAKYLMHKNNL